MTLRSEINGIKSAISSGAQSNTIGRNNRRSTDSTIESITPNVQNANQRMGALDNMRYGLPVSNSVISQPKNGGTEIRGGDSVSNPYSSRVSNSKAEGNEASHTLNNGINIKRDEKSPLKISDDDAHHPNEHIASSTKDSPLTVNTGRADGDKYHINAQEGSTTTINGQGGEKSIAAERDVIDYRPHLSNPSSTSTINLESFNPSKTDLRVDGKSVFGEGLNQSFSGEITIGRESNSSERNISMNIKPSEDE